MNKLILFKKRPVGKPVLGDFKFSSESIPSPLEGEILLKALYVSVDPYLRGRMNDSKSNIRSFELNKPIQSGIISEIMVSNHNSFQEGDFVSGNLNWKEYQTSNGNGLNKLNARASELTPFLGILGMTGLPAYLGLTEIGCPKTGETLVKRGKLTYAETIVEGFNHIPQAFIDLFEGKNEGKMIVKI